MPVTGRRAGNFLRSVILERADRRVGIGRHDAILETGHRVAMAAAAVRRVGILEQAGPRVGIVRRVVMAAAVLRRVGILEQAVPRVGIVRRVGILAIGHRVVMAAAVVLRAARVQVVAVRVRRLDRSVSALNNPPDQARECLLPV